MFVKFIIVFLALLLICNSAKSQEVQHEDEADLIFYLDEAMLMSKFYEETVKSGLKVDDVKRKLTQKGIKFILKKIPWVRIIRESKSKDNYLIYGFSKTEQREPQFYWLTSLHEGVERNVNLYSSREIKRLNLSKQDILKSKYKAICKVGKAACNYLKEFGFKPDQISIIPYSTDPANLEQLIIRKRAHFFAGTQAYVEKNLIALGVPLNTISSVFEISTVGLYIVGSKGMNENLLNRVTVALQ